MAKVMILVLGVILLWVSGSMATDVSFPVVPEWKQSGEVQTFVPKTLYEYINGAADLYLASDFEELKVAEYRNEKKASVVVEAYRHRTPEDAFGIYSQERLPEADVLDIGAQGYLDAHALNFFSGPYYIKISSYNTEADEREVLLAFAAKMSDCLGKKGMAPPLLSAFPAEGKKERSEKFITRNFLGYQIFMSVFTADYEQAGNTFKLFIVQATDREAGGNILRQYLLQTGHPRPEANEGRLEVTDPHHGPIALSWQGRYLLGVAALTNDDLRSRYLGLLEEGVRGFP